MNDLLTAMADSANLEKAWDDVWSKDSGPGIDGVTVGEFSRHARSHLRTLRRQLLRGAYQPLPLRGSYREKLSGGWRAIGAPCVRDRVAQRACLNVLAPLLEPHFEECSYAYRPGRSIYHALAQVETWRAAGHRVILDADVEKCFDRIDRSLLLGILGQYVRDASVLALLQLWLEAGVIFQGWTPPEIRRTHAAAVADATASGRPQPLVSPLGIPQGDIISPLLCNVFLDEFDEALLGRGFKLVRYADDFIVAGKNAAEAREALHASESALASLRLSLNREKTRIVTFEEGFKFLGTVFLGETAMAATRPDKRPVAIEDEIIFVPGYPFDPPRTTRRRESRDRAAQRRPRQKVHHMPGLVSVALAFQNALAQKRPPADNQPPRSDEKPWETTYLVETPYR
jgi:retron-type reverse transcriptase